MSKVRIRFTKEGPIKFISHLDILRTFNRAIKRAGLPIAYSQGFNPHMLISFGLPLSVGFTSECEYMDIELIEEVDNKTIIDRLNTSVPKGIKILKAKKLDDKEKSIMNQISMAEYELVIDLVKQLNFDLKNEIKTVLSLNEINVEKKTKKGIKQVNILPKIHNITVKQSDNKKVSLFMRLDAGSSSNLNPGLVLKGFEKYIDGFEVDYAQVHRKSLLHKDGTEIL